MTRVRPAVSAAGVSLLALVVVAATVAAVAPDGMAPLVAVAGVVGVAVGLLGGLPALVPVGVLALVLAHTAAVGGSGALVHPTSAVVVPAVWIGFEFAMRSFDLRTDVRPGRPATLDHLVRVAAIAAGSGAMALAVVGAAGVVPEGGLTFRLAAVACALLLAAVAAVLAVSRRPTPP